LRLSFTALRIQCCSRERDNLLVCLREDNAAGTDCVWGGGGAVRRHRADVA